MATFSGTLDLYSYIKPFEISSLDLQTLIHSWDTIDLKSDILGFRPPEILNFFLDEDQYTTASSVAWANIVDYYRQINTDQTYFLVDGAVVSGTFTAITVSGVTASGTAYRMSYDPADDFGSLGGPTLFRVHVENDLGGVYEEDYYLTFGYRIDFENTDHKYIDFGHQKQVVVRTLVENLASCPKESGEAYWFETRSLPYNDLRCYIKGSYIDGLPAKIYPQSTTYFYGQVCRVVVNARDFAGNKMEPFILVYTIEDES